MSYTPSVADHAPRFAQLLERFDRPETAAKQGVRQPPIASPTAVDDSSVRSASTARRTSLGETPAIVDGLGASHAFGDDQARCGTRGLLATTAIANAKRDRRNEVADAFAAAANGDGLATGSPVFG